jgi:transposase
MLRQMERSAIHVLAKRGKSQRTIARDLGISRVTVARALQEPVDRQPADRSRTSTVDTYRPQIEQWLSEGLSIVRMYELARADEHQPFGGGQSTFSDRVRQIRSELKRQQADVPVRFEGLPGEYLQVDWGEIRHLRFTRQPPATRYFLCCRLKCSRWTWIHWTTDMRQETMLRGLIECFCTLGWVPWVLVFDNMKTVTTGRDSANQPVWHPTFRQVAAEFGFHPEACAVGRANQKGTVESLVKWVKGNFLGGRRFADDTDLAQQAAEWMEMANSRMSDATGVPPKERVREEASQGGSLPHTAHDYGFPRSARVTAESLIHLRRNVYSVPIANVGTTVTARVYLDEVRIFYNTDEIARHRRAPDGGRRRVIDPEHFRPLFTKKPRAQVMLYRQALLELSPAAARYMSQVSYRRRDRLRDEVLGTYMLLMLYGRQALTDAMAQATVQGSYGHEYLEVILWPSLPDRLPSPTLTVDLPAQDEVDRDLEQYESFVTISAGGSTW